MTEHPLIAFLRARFDEDEQTARTASGPKARYTRWDLSEWHGRDEPHALIGQGTPDQPLVLGNFTGPVETTHAEHIARHDPAYVLADVASKRLLLGLHRECDSTCYIVKVLALPHATHPDYQPEWAPR